MTSRILIIDDSEMVARQLRAVLCHHESLEIVGHARDGVQGVEMYKELQPDLVLLDMIMPIMDGEGTLVAIRAHDPDARVLIVTSTAGLEARVNFALEHGAIGVVSKPINAEYLTYMVDTTLYGARL